jgi:signal peptidase II
MLKYFLLVIFIALSDQLTKILVIKNIANDQFVSINSYFYLVNFKNSGAAFSFLSDAGGWQRYFLSIVAAIASVYIVFMIKKHRDDLFTGLALSLILGGALGNLYDRISLGYVTDFLYFHYNDYYWPAFNIADTAISIGAIILIYEVLVKKS